jgi:hypothetical protein
MSYGNQARQWELEAEPELEPDAEPAPWPEPVPGNQGTEPAPTREPVPGTTAREPGTGNRAAGTGQPQTAWFPGVPVPGDTELVPGGQPGTAGREPGPPSGAVPGDLVPRERISLGEDLWLEFRRWFRRAMAEQEKHGGIGHWVLAWIYEGQPESPRQVSAYADSRQWLQPYMTDWIRWVAEWENVLYLRFIGIPVVAVLNKLSDIFARQSRLAVAVLTGIIALVIYLAHH